MNHGEVFTDLREFVTGSAIYVGLVLAVLILVPAILRLLYSRRSPHPAGGAIPTWFRCYYWFKKEMWATGTILLLAILSIQLVAGLLEYPIFVAIFLLALFGAFVFAQFSIFARNQQRQGRVEYEYREHAFTRAQRTALYQHVGTAPLLSPSIFPEKYEQLMVEGQRDNALTPYLCAKLAEGAMKDLDFQKAVGYLGKALLVDENDVIMNARVAKAYERMGRADDAIKHYEAATRDPLNSPQLNAFLSAEANRVRTKGPTEYDWRGALHRM